MLRTPAITTWGDVSTGTMGRQGSPQHITLGTHRPSPAPNPKATTRSVPSCTISDRRRDRTCLRSFMVKPGKQ